MAHNLRRTKEATARQTKEFRAPCGCAERAPSSARANLAALEPARENAPWGAVMRRKRPRAKCVKSLPAWFRLDEATYDVSRGVLGFFIDSVIEIEFVTNLERPID